MDPEWNLYWEAMGNGQYESHRPVRFLSFQLDTLS